MLRVAKSGCDRQNDATSTGVEFLHDASLRSDVALTQDRIGQVHSRFHCRLTYTGNEVDPAPFEHLDFSDHRHIGGIVKVGTAPDDRYRASRGAGDGRCEDILVPMACRVQATAASLRKSPADGVFGGEFPGLNGRRI